MASRSSVPTATTSVFERLEGLDLLAEDLELLHAVGALAAEEEEDDDVPPLVVGERPGLAVGVGQRDRLGREGRPGERAEGRQVDPVGGRLVGRPARRPAAVQRLSAFQRGDDRRRAGGRRGRPGRPRGPAARACGRPPAPRSSLPTAWRISTSAASGGTWFGLLLDGLPARRSRRSRSSGRPGGPGPAPRAHRGRLGEPLEGAADVALGQLLIPFQLGQGRVGPAGLAAAGAPAGRSGFVASSATRAFSAAICSASFAWSPLAA